MMAFKKSYCFFSFLRKRQQTHLSVHSLAYELEIIYCLCRKPTKVPGRREMTLPCVLLSSMGEWSGEVVVRSEQEAWNGCPVLASRWRSMGQSSIPVADLHFIQNVITGIKHGMQGHFSRVPMPSLWVYMSTTIIFV
jgi:hypothetical protein